MHAQALSCVQLCVNPWTIAHQDPWSMRLLRQEYWSGLLFLHWRWKWQPTPVFLPRESWIEEPDGLVSIGSHRVRHDWRNLACTHALEKEMATHSSILAWRIPGMEEPGGLLSMRSHRVGHDWSDLAAAAATISQQNWPSTSASSQTLF